MKSIFEQARKYFKENDSWLYLSVFLVLSAERAINVAPHSWTQYWSSFLTLLLSYLPVLIFVHFKKGLKQRLFGWRYMLIWLLTFVGWSLLIISYFNLDDYYTGLSIALAGLDLALEASRYWTKDKRLISGLKKISIDRAMLLIILFFSTLYSLMAVSNLERFYTDSVIDTSVNLIEVANHFFLFLSYVVQFFLIYATLYFFYLLNDRILIPLLLKERGILAYLIGGAGSIALFFPLFAQMLVMLPLLKKVPALMPQQTLEVFTELNAIMPFIVLTISLPVIVALQWFKQNNKITNLEKQQAEQELSLLKHQMNPHFFFNTLNNLYALSLEKSDQSPEVIVQLSELMRYVIYKGKEKEVRVAEEVAYIKDYIELQQIRLHKKVDLQFKEEVATDAMLVPPLLLIILVENAFKHGVEPAERNCFLHMDLKSSAQSLDFICQNSFEAPLSEKQGIGLENLKRRLELLYPNSHQLTTEIKDHIFTANLSIWTA